MARLKSTMAASRSVVVMLVKLGQAAVVVIIGRVGAELNRATQIHDGAVVVPFLQLECAAPVNRRLRFRVQINRAAEVGDGAVLVTVETASAGPVEQTLSVVRLRADVDLG